MNCPRCGASWNREYRREPTLYQGSPVVYRRYRCYQCGHEWSTTEHPDSVERVKEEIRQEARSHAIRIWQLARAPL